MLTTSHISGKQPPERWRDECRSVQEDTMWMEQLKGAVRDHIPSHVKGYIHN